MRVRFAFAALAVGLLAVGTGCAPESAPSSPAFTAPAEHSPQATATAPSEPSIAAVDEVITEVGVPWGIDFFDDGDAIVSLRDTAELLRVSPDGERTSYGIVPGVAGDTDEGGLLGLAMKPGDEDILFAYLTSSTDNRVVRMSIAGGSIRDVTPIVTGIARAANHNGGQLMFDPDGNLLVSTGDAADPSLAQDTSSLNGKILRVDEHGDPIPGNPFGNRVYSYGHRNVQGLSFDSQGRLWATEFGQDTTDELNPIEAGGNYGWPEKEGADGDPAYVDPFASWTPTSTASPSGLEIVDDIAYLGALRGTALFAVPLTGDRAGATFRLLEGEYGRIRAVAAAPDGALWITTSNTAGWIEPRPGDDRVLRLDID
ncbi:PQQ-dependent sugar dehydrogenase [Microbacterium tenebrionis]|uniref:PQQ-dependent sugar dehydrogenase n=1 Tax=Microbacterium tenebrionis TaxID=2830665 RepID=UPI00158A785D|nr:PQQ-dependent sugar dehydrogenase [Microbacterium ihumii]